jgi:hypothetical protein
MSCQTLTDIGVKKCKSVLEVLKMIIIVPLYGSDGTKNKLTLANAKLLSAWVAKFNAVSTEDRFYPTPLLENVSTERAASEFETLNSGIKIKLRKGTRNFIGYAIKQGPEFLKAIETWEDASGFAFYGVDAAANLLYKSVSGTTDVYPLAIEDGSFDTMIILPTDSAVEKEMIQFDVASYEKDSCLKVLAYVDMTDVNLLTDAYALIDASVEGVSGTTTVVTADITDLNGYPVENLVTADFYSAVGGTASKVYNVTTSSAVTVVAAESSTVAGRYTFTFSAQSAADVIRITPVKEGYDFTAGTQVLS